MTPILLECLLFFSLGYALKKWAPLGFEAETTRKAIISLIYILLLPALVIKSLWLSPPELIQWKINLSIIITLFITTGLIWLIYRKLTTNTATLGALILAGSTYQKTSL